MDTTLSNSAILTKLGHLSIEEFLKAYWQKKPLLIKQAFPSFTSPLDADELAGLSLEDESQFLSQLKKLNLKIFEIK